MIAREAPPKLGVIGGVVKLINHIQTTMLIGFSVENHRSFKEAASLVSIDELKKPLKFSFLFGANNSGKTNFIRAIEAMTMMRFCLFCCLPFKMDDISKNESSFFEIVILAESGDRIQYGFKVKDDRIEEEWLYKYHPSDDVDTPIILFERFAFVAMGRYQEDLLDTQPFLNKTSIFEAKLVREFFDSIYFAFSTNKNDLDEDIFDFVNNSPTLKSRLSDLMSRIDLPIPDSSLELPTSRGFDEAFGFLNLLLFAEAKKIKLLAIDNFGENLHPLLASELINIAKSISGLQLIISTHQTRLIDEVSPWAIWFVEKDNKQSSTLTGLVEYKLKPDSISQKYLNGLYGDTPFVTIR